MCPSDQRLDQLQAQVSGMANTGHRIVVFVENYKEAENIHRVCGFKYSRNSEQKYLLLYLFCKLNNLNLCFAGIPNFEKFIRSQDTNDFFLNFYEK